MLVRVKNTRMNAFVEAAGMHTEWVRRERQEPVENLGEM